MTSRIAAGVVAGLFAFGASPAFAQPGEERKPAQDDAVRKLQAELEKLRATQAEVEAQLRRLGVEGERKRVIERVEIDRAVPNRDELKKRIDQEIDRALRAKDSGLKRAEAELDRARQLLEGREKPRPAGDFERMNPDELKELIVRLQRILAEKTRGAGKPGAEKVRPGAPDKAKPGADKVRPGAPDKAKPGADKVRPGAPDKAKPGAEKVKPGAASQDEIQKRLDKLAAEVEELKRAIKR
jgi:cell division protein FtsB